MHSKLYYDTFIRASFYADRARGRFYSVTNSTWATQRFSANHKTSSEQKNRSSFISDQIYKWGQMWQGIDAKGNAKDDCDSSIYGEMLFIFITKRRPKNFEKQTKK